MYLSILCVFFKQSRNCVRILMEVVVGPWVAVVPLPPLCWSAPALSRSHTNANMTFGGGLLSPEIKCLRTEVQEPVRQPVAGLRCQTQRQQLALTPRSACPLAGQAGWGRQQCYLEIAILSLLHRFSSFSCSLRGGVLLTVPRRLYRNEGAQWYGGVGLCSSNSSLLVKPLFPGCVDGTPGLA